MREKQLTNDSLLIPVYLNQRTVFDLLAMLQDGLAQVTRIASTETSRDTEGGKVSANFGLGAALAGLLKINLGASKSETTERGGQLERSEERVHTPASLLFKLRQILSAQQRVVVIAGQFEPEVGTIVEFTTTLRRNPLVEAMDAMVGMLDMSMIFVEQPKKSGKSSSQQSEYKPLKNQMERFRDSLKAGGTIDIVSDKLPGGYSALITLEEEFLSDPTMADLVDGQFRVLGKIIRVVPAGAGSISLIRKTAMSAMPSNTVIEAFSHLDSASNEGAFRFPAMKWEIPGPVFQLLPIGIYA